MCDQTEPLCEIRDFTAFLQKCLQRKVLDFTLKPLTKPGDNYGSLIQSVDVKVTAGSDREEVNRLKQLTFLDSDTCLKSFTLQTETLHLVVKLSVTNPYLIKIFQPSVTFVKETHFYSDIIPAIKYFQQISNVAKNDLIDAFIRCPGSRISLNPSTFNVISSN